MNFVNTGINNLIKKAFEEDFPFGDITSESIFDWDDTAEAVLTAKEPGVIAGIDIFKCVFDVLGNVRCEILTNDGTEVQKGDKLAVLSGNTIQMLKGERTALNIIQRMSGIATLTRKLVKLLECGKTRLLDTRKTTPGFRYAEKYAVTVGGGYNHRYSLSDGILIKDNHIAACGSIRAAVERARTVHGFVRKIEVETETLDMVREALDAHADIIMLDNMDVETLTEAVALINGRAVTECSGNVNADNLSKLANIGLDYISCGALTHSYKSMDLSLKIKTGTASPLINN